MGGTEDGAKWRGKMNLHDAVSVADWGQVSIRCPPSDRNCPMGGCNKLYKGTHPIRRKESASSATSNCDQTQPTRVNWNLTRRKGGKRSQPGPVADLCEDLACLPWSGPIKEMEWNGWIGGVKSRLCQIANRQ